MALAACAAVLLIVVCGSEGYKEGPPIDDHSNICVTLFPEGHGATPKTSPPPFEIDVSDTCTTNDPIFVTISTTDNKTWFEGIFVQARSARGGNQTYGEFGTNGDRQLQGLKCYNSPNPEVDNSIAHREAKHYFSKKFTWRPPPNGVEGGVTFLATVVHETEDFWVNVRSPVVATPCAAAAAAAALLPKLATFVLTATIAYYNCVGQ